MMYLLLFFISGLIISQIEGLPLISCLFETGSAIGTVGLGSWWTHADQKGTYSIDNTVVVLHYVLKLSSGQEMEKEEKFFVSERDTNGAIIAIRDAYSEEYNRNADFSLSEEE